MKHAFLVVLLLMLNGSVQARTEQCTMRVTEPKDAIESPEIVKAGFQFESITQMRAQRLSSRIMYYAHDNYCYSPTNPEFIVPCRAEADSSYQHEGERMYDLQEPQFKRKALCILS